MVTRSQPCSGFFPGLDAGAFRLFRHALLVARRAERITQQTKERLLRRKTCFPPKPAPCSRPAPYPAPVSCSGSFSHSAPQLWRPGPRTKRRAKGVAPRRRQAWHECAEYRALNRSRPRSPASRMQIRTGRSSPASALSGATRSAQSRTPESLETRHRPIPCRARAGRSDARSRLPGRVSAQRSQQRRSFSRRPRSRPRPHSGKPAGTSTALLDAAADALQHGGRSFPRSFPAVPLTATPAHSDAPALQLSSGRRSGTPPRLCRQKKTHGMGRPTLDKTGKNIFFVNFYSRKKSFPPSSRFFIFPAIPAY